MTCTAAQLVKVAAAEIGTKEVPAGSNKVKYNTWYYGRAVSGAAYPWCAVFTSWCVKQAGGYDYLSGLSNKAYCPDFVTWAKKKGYWLGRTTAPKAGDIVIFGNKGEACHIGIVEKKLTNSSVQTIEGNTSVTSNDNGGAVMRRTRAYGSSGSSWYIMGFIRLPFKTTATTKTTVVKSTTATTFKSYNIKTTAASGLNLRKTASTKAEILACIPKNTTLKVTAVSSDKKWGKITYTTKSKKTYTGYIYLSYTKKI